MEIWQNLLNGNLKLMARIVLHGLVVSDFQIFLCIFLLPAADNWQAYQRPDRCTSCGRQNWGATHTHTSPTNQPRDLPLATWGPFFCVKRRWSRRNENRAARQQESVGFSLAKSRLPVVVPVFSWLQEEVRPRAGGSCSSSPRSPLIRSSAGQSGRVRWWLSPFSSKLPPLFLSSFSTCRQWIRNKHDSHLIRW